MQPQTALTMGLIPERAPWLAASLLAVGVAALGTLAVYFDTAASIVSIWMRSETFVHGFIVVPLCVWLAWRNRTALAAVTTQAWWPGLAFVLAAGALWFVMSVADVVGVQQFALAFMLQAGIVTVIGLGAARVVAFPLAFLLFAIPAGEFLVPILMNWTADFTVAALRLTGVPVFREGNHFSIPSGSWAVADACSGVRYLIASVMIGTIYAFVAFRSIRRRIAFVAASIVVPIFANWVRAYTIVMIGHLSNNEYAVGVDHLIYGWIFFGLVMTLLFWTGSRWQESPVDPSASQHTECATAADGRHRGGQVVMFAAAIAVVGVAGVWRLIPVDRDPPAVTRPLDPVSIVGTGGWSPVTRSGSGWRPHYQGHVAELEQTFGKDLHEVSIYVAFYRQQRKGRELVTSGNSLTGPENWTWKEVSRGTTVVDWAGMPVDATQAVLAGPSGMLEIIKLYWVGGRVTASPYVAKAWLAWARLMGTGDDSALIVAYTRGLAPGNGGFDALKAFAHDMSTSIDRSIAESVHGRR